MNNRHLTLTLAVALALASPCASALGLGQLQVKSGLNQPLVAEIPIISATASELDQLDVRLASPEAFSRIGLERPGELTANLQFSVGTNAAGQPVIRITTPGRFSEPLLSFLIEAEWGKGAVTREYTALIDPPYIAAAVIQPLQAPTIAAAPLPMPVAPAVTRAPEPEPQVAEAQTVPAPEPEPVEVSPVEPEPVAQEPVAQEPEPAPAPRPSRWMPPPPQPAAPGPRPAPVAVAPAPETTPEPPAAQPGEVGPIAAGQTLWSIANSVRPDPAVTVNQMMLALLRANPDAFAQDNINQLKKGSVLRVPTREDANRISAADAAALVSQQASAWRAPREAIPQPSDSSADANIAAAPVEPRASTPRASTPPRATSRLEIVPPSGARAKSAQSGAAAGAGGSELRAELVQTREELAARTSEVTELKSRVSDLEKQDTDRQRLIEMQNSQMKELQDRMQRMQAEQAANAAQPGVVAPAATPAATSPATATPAAALAEPPAAKPWYMSWYLLGGAALVLLGGLVFAMRRKPANEVVDNTRRLSDDEALRASIAKTREASVKIKPEPVPAVRPAAVAAVLPADPELEILRGAVASRPHDLEAHLSLLRLYHARGNAVEYEVAAQAMRAQVPSTMDPRWREAVIMGASLMPGHTLFSQAGWNSPRFSEPETPARSAPPATVAVPVVPAAPVRVFDEPLESDLPVDDSPSKMLDLDDHASVFGDSLGAPPDDLHRNEAQMMVEDDTSSTRIELAKAYLDIGDLDGARSMLEEVLAEGGPSAQAEAGRILKEIG